MQRRQAAIRKAVQAGYPRAALRPFGRVLRTSLRSYSRDISSELKYSSRITEVVSGTKANVIDRRKSPSHHYQSSELQNGNGCE